EIDPSQPRYGDAMAAEVDRLRSGMKATADAEEGPESPPPGDEDEEAPDGSDRPPSASVGAEGDDQARPVTTEEVSAPVSVGEAVAEAAPGEADAVEAEERSELDGLFARLQDRQSSVAGVTEPAPEARHEPGEASESSSVAEPSPAERAFEVRDRLLLPLQNAALRGIKRRLTELQNVVLDELRVSRGEWSPDAPLFQTELAPDLITLAREAAAAGTAAAGELTGSDELPALPEAEPAEVTTVMADDVALGLGQALEQTKEAGGGPRALAAAASRVLRSWRTDEAERRVRAAAFAAYHAGLLGTLEALGVVEVRVVPNGRICTECPANQEAAWRPGKAPPAGAAIPPARRDCACTIIPTD
ncbi:MAG: hypothetical protein ACE5KX_06425, partial [Acidimicrobiia bacterium]